MTDVHTETRRGQASGVGAVGGAVAGGDAGHEIEKNRDTYPIWVVQVEERGGRSRRFERRADPGVQVGDEVRLTDGGFVR